ncbi:uncharacterized protein LOC144075167 [Stigmatopora argus]
MRVAIRRTRLLVGRILKHLEIFRFLIGQMNTCWISLRCDSFTPSNLCHQYFMSSCQEHVCPALSLFEEKHQGEEEEEGSGLACTHINIPRALGVILGIFIFAGNAKRQPTSDLAKGYFPSNFPNGRRKERQSQKNDPLAHRSCSLPARVARLAPLQPAALWQVLRDHNSQDKHE